MISNPRLYAVVDRGAPTPAHRQNIAQLREQKHNELKGKQAIDRANAVLDRVEQRIANYDAQLADLKRQAAAIQERKDLALARQEHLEDAIIERMERAHLQHAPGFHRWFRTQPATAKLEVLDRSLIPSGYFHKPKPPEPDKVAIKAAIARGEEIAGVRLTQKISLVRK